MTTKTNPSHRSVFYKIAAAMGLSIVASLGLLSVVFAEPIHTRLNPDLVEGGVIKSYTISPDGNLVVYIADQETKGTDELYIVPIDGGTPKKLNSTLVADEDVTQFHFTPDSTHVAYIVHQQTTGANNLYIVPSEGGIPMKSDTALQAYGGIHQLLFTPDSKYIIYFADSYSIYSVPVSGGSSIEIVDPLPLGQLYSYAQLSISPDSKWFVYTKHKTEFNNGQTRTEFSLTATPIDQQNPITLSGPFVQGRSIGGFNFSPDSKSVVYQSDQDIVGVYELYRIPIQGGVVTKLSVPLQTGDGVYSFYFSPDRTHIIYLANVEGTVKLFRVALDTAISTQIAESDTDLMKFDGKFSPDGKQLLYSGYNSRRNLYIASVSDGAPLLLSTATDVGEGWVGMSSYGFTPDSNNVIVSYFSAPSNAVTSYVFTSFVIPIRGSSQKKTFRYSALGDGFSSFKVSQDSKYAIFPFFNSDNQVGRFYSTDLDISTNVTLTVSHDYDGRFLALTPDGNGVVFRSKATQTAPAKIMNLPFTSTIATTLSVDTSFDVGFTQSIPVDIAYDDRIPAPLLHGEQVCQVYTLQNPSKDLYSSCVPSLLPPKKNVYLPVIAR